MNVTHGFATAESKSSSMCKLCKKCVYLVYVLSQSADSTIELELSGNYSVSVNFIETNHVKL